MIRAKEVKHCTADQMLEVLATDLYCNIGRVAAIAMMAEPDSGERDATAQIACDVKESLETCRDLVKMIRERLDPDYAAKPVSLIEVRQ